MRSVVQLQRGALTAAAAAFDVGGIDLFDLADNSLDKEHDLQLDREVIDAVRDLQARHPANR